jgi:hypothetical protein
MGKHRCLQHRLKTDSAKFHFHFHFDSAPLSFYFDRRLSDELSVPRRHSSTGASSSGQEATTGHREPRRLGALAPVCACPNKFLPSFLPVWHSSVECADERLAARDPAASVTRLVTA